MYRICSCLFFICFLLGYEINASSRTFPLLSKSRMVYGRFTPITHQTAQNPSSKDDKGLQLFFRKLTSRLQFPSSDLWKPELSLESYSINDYVKNWYPWMLLKCDPVALNTLSGFELPQPSRENFSPLKRSQKTYKHLEPTYVPSTFENENIKKWIEVCNLELQSYREGMGRLPRFFYDLLHRKVQSILLNLTEAERSQFQPPNIGNESEKTFEAYSLLELVAYFYKVNKTLGDFDERKFVYYPVPNGVPISAVYENGVVKEIYTEVFGQRKDLMEVISTVNVPKTINNTNSVKLNGYLYLDSTAMEFLNAERRSHGQRNFVDAYSAVAEALLQNSEPNRSLELKLKCMFDDLEYLNQETRISKQDQLAQLNKEDFPSVDPNLVTVGNSKLGLVYPLSNKQLSFEALGCKVVLNNTGEKALVNLPDAIVKFPPETQKTKIESIKFEVLDNGCILSTVHTSPVILGGVTYTMFTLSNETELINLNLQVNDDIEVIKIQGAPPRIYRSFANGGAEFMRYPKECPQCLNPLSRKLKSFEIINFCAAHLQCKDETVSEIMRFSSVHGLHIPSLTEHIIKELKRKSKAFNYLDLMDLSVENYSVLDGISREIYDRLIDEIHAGKQTTLPRLLYALNIPGVDFVVAERLANQFGSLQRISQATVAELTSHNLVVPEQIKEMVEWFQNPISQRKIKRLFERGVKIYEPSKKIINLCYKTATEYREEDYNEIVKAINEYTNTHEVSDFEYDRLGHVANDLERKHPEWAKMRHDKSAVSDTTKDNTLFTNEPVVYMGKTYEINELLNLIAKMGKKAKVKDDKLELIVEPKVDGVACVLQYKDGKLVAAYTKKANRGNDITNLVLKVPSIPKSLNTHFSGIVRGELFITKGNFSVINEGIIQDGNEEYVDSLSLLVGAINSKHVIRSSILSSIEFFPFWMQSNSTVQHSINDVTPKNVHDHLTRLGFVHSVKKPYKTFKTLNELKEYVNNALERRLEQPSNIDGMVIKVAESKECLACAYKFNRETRESTLEGIDFIITKGKRIQAVAHLTPINFGKRKISRVYIPNPLVLKGVKKGDLVSIHYAAGSAPIFNRIDKQSSKKTKATEISLPHSCPVCSTKLTTHRGFLWCKNSRCGGNQKREDDLLKFAQKMRMISVSAHVAWYRELIEKGVVNTFGDFFRITPEEVASTTSLSIEQAQVLLANVMRISSSGCAYVFNRMIPGFKASEMSISRLTERVPEPKMLLEQSPQELVAHGLTMKQARALHEYSKKNTNDFMIVLSHIMRKTSLNTPSTTVEASKKLMQGAHNRVIAANEKITELSKDLKRIIDINEKEYPLLIAVTPSDRSAAIIFKKALKEMSRYDKANKSLLCEIEKNAVIGANLRSITHKIMELKPKHPVVSGELEDDFLEIDFSDSTSDVDDISSGQ